MHNHHKHDHSHSSSNRIGWAFFLNFGFTIIEFIGGWLTNSTAIMADAVHDLGDSLSIGFAWILTKVSNKPANTEYSYGYRRLSLFGALINGVILIIGSVWVLFEAVPRLFDPVMPVSEGMFLLALFGISVNGLAAYKLSHGKTLNERVLNWHLLEDVLGWVAVLCVSIILMFFEWPILDPILSIGFTIFIGINVFRTVGQTLRIFLQAVPDKNVRKKIEQQLESINNVVGIHHLHIWSLDGEHHVLTVHIVLDKLTSMKDQMMLKQQIAELLKPHEFAHTTIEFEFYNEICRDC